MVPLVRLAPLLVTLLAVVLLPAGARAEEDDDAGDPEITRKELKEHVKVLSDDDWEGREAGEPGSEKAAAYIVAHLERLGLKPAGTEGFFQPFTSPKGTKVLPTSSLVAVGPKAKETAFELGKDFTPINVSAAGAVDAEVVFAGYGIHAPRLAGSGYSDYDGLEVKGKVVLVLRRAPRWEDKRKSPFAAPGVMAQHATFKAKADAAAARGAAALIVVNDPASTSKSDDELQQPGGSTTGKLPVLHMTWQAAKRLGSRIGLRFLRQQRRIDAKLAPQSTPVEGARIRLCADLAPDIRKMKNIAAVLEPGGAVTTGGDGAGPSQTLLLGAHYDHVGRGWFGSLANANGEIHNGADDNASGTTALMEIAGWFVARREQLKRRVLFVWFSGEELGLLGSKHYVREPLVPLADTVAMLNLDMVGRLHKNRLFVGGTGTAPIWPAMLERLNKSARFEMTKWPGGKAPSDHASFYEANLPVLFFFTGLHGDYHRPSDDWNTLEYKGHERVARFAAAVALEVANADERPQFTRCDAGGFAVGPYTGLAVEQRDEGVFVAHVDKKSPAHKAGFKAGDRILTWAGADVPDTTRWNGVVSKAKPGDKVAVEVERKGRKRKLTLKLGKT